MGLSKHKPKSGTAKAPRLSEEVKVLDFSQYDKQWVSLRAIGPATSFGQAWINLGPSEKTGRDIKFPKNISCYNPADEEFEGSDPYYKFAMETDNQRVGQQYLMNFIVRDLQEDYKAGKRNEKEKKARAFNPIYGDKTKYHFKDFDNTRSGTPVRVVQLSATVMGMLQNLKKANKVKIKGETKYFDIDDPKHGADINIMYDSSQSGTAKWQVSIDTKDVALTEEEMKLLIWDIDPEKLASCKPDSKEEMKSEVKRWEKALGENDDDSDDDDEDEDDKPKKKKKNKYLDDDDEDEDDKPKKKKGKKKKADEDEEDEDDDDDDLSGLDDDEEEEEKPKKKKKKKGKKSSDDDGEDDEEEDDKPKKKKKKKKKVDEDEDEDDAEDDDDEPKKKKKGKKKK